MTAPPLRKKVVGVGLACLDQLLLWQDVTAPVAGNKVVNYDVQGGGMVGTALVAVARLGGQAELWGAVGDDWMGDLILQGLRREKVDTGQVVRVRGGRGPMVLVCIDRPTGERYFLHWTGFPDPPQPLGSLESLHSAGCLLIDGAHQPSALRAGQEAHRLGVPVVADFSGVGEGTRALLAVTDYAIVSQLCLKSLGVGGDYRRACAEISAMGPPHVVMTLGPDGLVWLTGDRFDRMNAFAVEVVDTTGAGDVFHGAFCYGLTESWALETLLAFASATAAMKCRRMGGRAGIPGRVQVEAFLKERGAHLPPARHEP